MSLTAAAIAGLAAAAINGGISLYSNSNSQQAMARYRNALQADRERAAQKESYLENVDPLHTKMGSALSTDLSEKLNDINTAAAGRNAVMGGNGHNTAATKDANSSILRQGLSDYVARHSMYVMPQINYYRSQYDRANQGLEKAEYDKSIANINAASQAAQGAINAVAAVGSQMAAPTTDATTDGWDRFGVKPVTSDGNGTPVGTIDAKKIIDQNTIPAYTGNPLIDDPTIGVG